MLELITGRYPDSILVLTRNLGGRIVQRELSRGVAVPETCPFSFLVFSLQSPVMGNANFKYLVGAAFDHNYKITKRSKMGIIAVERKILSLAHELGESGQDIPLLSDAVTVSQLRTNSSLSIQQAIDDPLHYEIATKFGPLTVLKADQTIPYFEAE